MTYDTLGRVTTVTDPLGFFGYGYEGTTDRLLQVSHDGLRLDYIYYDNSKDRRLKEITNEGQDVLTSDFFYAYQAEGEIIKIKRKLPYVSEDLLGYDLADQLTYATRGTTNSYVYDSAGNRTQEVIAGAQTDFVHNNVNELISRSGAQGSATFAYDPNGSLTSDGTRTFDWDGANRLVAVNIGTHRSEFSYDGIGRPVSSR